MQCVNRINEILSKLNTYGPRNQIDRAFNRQPGPQRKTYMNNPTAAYQQDESEQNDEMKQEISKVVELLRRAILQNMKKKGMKITTEDSKRRSLELNDEIAQLSDALRRMEVKNKISGVNVDTNQDIEELNNGKNKATDILKLVKASKPDMELKATKASEIVEAQEPSKASEKVKALELVKEAEASAQTIGNNPPNDKLKMLLFVLRRISLANNIKGDKVTTKQKLVEHNDASQDDAQQLEQALRRISLQNNIKGEDVQTDQKLEEFNDELRELVEAVRRLSLKNNIKGKHVRTKQKVEEFSDEIQHLEETLRRIALKNNIKGVNVKTSQKLEEHNDDAILDELEQALQRISLQNNIQGATVETKQNLEEHNDEVEAYDDEATVNALVDRARRIALVNNIQGDIVSTNQELMEYNRRRDQNDETQTKRGLSYLVKSVRRGDRIPSADETNEAYDEASELAEDEMADAAEIQRETRKMIVNNNINGGRRILIDNNIEGDNVNTKQKLVENNRPTDPLVSTNSPKPPTQTEDAGNEAKIIVKGNDAQGPIVSEKPEKRPVAPRLPERPLKLEAQKIKPEDVKAIANGIENNESSKTTDGGGADKEEPQIKNGDIVCSSKSGKVSDNDVKMFVDIVRKLKAAHKAGALKL